MTRYLISFPGDAMGHIPDEDEPEVSRAAHAVIQEAKDAGVFLFAGGLDEDVAPVMVAGDGGVEFADLLIEAFGEISVGVADGEPDLIHHRSPSTGTLRESGAKRWRYRR